jgi:hypothetical protein
VSDPDASAGTETPSNARRPHVLAYNYWLSLLDGRSCPSIQDIDPAALDGFGPDSILLDLCDDVVDPRIAWIGQALMETWLPKGDFRRISELPKHSLLSRLSNHYASVVVEVKPIGFETVFRDPRGGTIAARGILMPFSTFEKVDFIYGVINSYY